MLAARKLDPKTGDVSATISRRFVRAGHPLDNKLVLAYLVPLGSWEGDPTIGHRFAELARAKNSVGTRQRLGDLVRQAAQWMIDAGDLDHVDVEVEYFGPGELAFEVDAYPPGATTPVQAGPFFVAIAT